MGHVARLAELSTSRQSEWVDRLFARLSALYGARFADMWSACDLAHVKEVWRSELADLAPEEVARGVEATRGLKFPPTLPEFFALCRPPIDEEAAFREAVEQMRRRERDDDRWSNPAIYWAAVSIGELDLRSLSWPMLKARWQTALRREMAKPCDPVPPRRAALPSPGGQTISSGAVRDRLAGVLVKTAGDGNRDWAGVIAARVEAGETVAHAVKSAAEQVIGRKLLRGGKHVQRPDAKDRQAGQVNEFDDDKMVVL